MLIIGVKLMLLDRQKGQKSARTKSQEPNNSGVDMNSAIQPQIVEKLRRLPQKLVPVMQMGSVINL